ncbi:type II secretion system F family protein [Schlesneria paludicola]|uniref:type II secretion system F family protein n=1 Tax=Schlesneria paludicola TaxID=360056 RepID=UPI00029B3D93|nr:type II secretion system F family protein [Schlesneria paludicola]
MNLSGSRPSPTLDELIALNYEIAALVRAGVPLEIGLRSSSDTDSRLTRLSGRLSQRLTDGMGLSDAVAQEGPAVSPIYTAVIEAGLASGRLPEALESLAESGQMIQETRRAVITASIYPLICLCVVYGLFCGFITWMIPMLLKSGDLIPARGVLRLLQPLYEHQRYFTMVIPCTVFALVVIIVLLRNGLTRGLWNWLLSCRWIVGRSLTWAQFTELLALQIEHQTALPRAFVLAADSVDDARWQREARQVSEQLTNGVPLKQALDAATSLPPLIRWMLATGEKQGSFAQTLRSLGETYRRRSLRRAAIVKVWLPVLITICFTGTIGLAYGLAFVIPLRELYEGLAQE